MVNQNKNDESPVSMVADFFHLPKFSSRDGKIYVKPDAVVRLQVEDPEQINRYVVENIRYIRYDEKAEVYDQFPLSIGERGRIRIDWGINTRGKIDFSKREVPQQEVFDNCYYDITALMVVADPWDHARSMLATIYVATKEIDLPTYKIVELAQKYQKETGKSGLEKLLPTPEFLEWLKTAKVEEKPPKTPAVKPAKQAAKKQAKKAAKKPAEKEEKPAIMNWEYLLNTGSFVIAEPALQNAHKLIAKALEDKEELIDLEKLFEQIGIDKKFLEMKFPENTSKKEFLNRLDKILISPEEQAKKEQSAEKSKPAKKAAKKASKPAKKSEEKPAKQAAKKQAKKAAKKPAKKEEKPAITEQPAEKKPELSALSTRIAMGKTQLAKELGELLRAYTDAPAAVTVPKDISGIKDLDKLPFKVYAGRFEVSDLSEEEIIMFLGGQWLKESPYGSLEDTIEQHVISTLNLVDDFRNKAKGMREMTEQLIPASKPEEAKVIAEQKKELTPVTSPKPKEAKEVAPPSVAPSTVEAAISEFQNLSEEDLMAKLEKMENPDKAKRGGK